MDLQTIKNKFGIIGTSPALNRALEVALQVAPTDLSVLITGQSGVGKEFFPQIIHSYSSRKHNPYIAVNCGAIPDGTIDSELFGHEKGSFTGATEARKGYFEEADGGTIFLDEVAELPLTTQVRLLRVLQSGEFIRVGSSKAQKTNVRVVAATNVNLHQAIESGRFREDLYYRLNTVPITVPSLHERKGDIVLLFRKFSSDIAGQYRMPTITLSPAARQMLENYSWPGNIRQLKNVAEQISAIEQGREIDVDTLKSYLPHYNPTTLPMLRPGSSHTDNTTERDILYKLLFDLRGEVTELKMMLGQLTKGVTPQNTGVTQHIATPIITHEEQYIEPEEVSVIAPPSVPLTKEEAQKQQIIDTLRRNDGRRKETAAELFMSERTLYRKIKDYNIE